MKTVINDVIKVIEEQNYQYFGIEESDRSNTYLKFMKNDEIFYVRVSNLMPVKIHSFSEDEYLNDRMKRNLREITRKMNSNPNVPTVEFNKRGKRIPITRLTKKK